MVPGVVKMPQGCEPGFLHRIVIMFFLLEFFLSSFSEKFTFHVEMQMFLFSDYQFFLAFEDLRHENGIKFCPVICNQESA